MSGVKRRGRARRRSLPLVCALAVALGVGACDPGDEPTDPGTTITGDETTEPTTPETSETPSDVPTPPELDQPVPPEEMSVDDRAGAAATVEYLFALADYAEATGDTRALEAISGPECGACAAVVSGAVELHEAGGWIESESSTISDIGVAYPEGDDPNYYVQFTLTAQAALRHEGDGSVTELEAVQYVDAVALVAWSGGEFIVNALSLTPED